MKHVIFFLSIVLAISVCAEDVKPVSLAGFSDKGTFYLYKYESSLAVITYTLSPKGEYNRTMVLSYAGQKITYGLQVFSDKNGYWKNLVMSMPQGKITASRKEGIVEYTVRNKNYKTHVGNKHIVYDSYGPVFEGLTLKQYDMKKKGKQTFLRFLMPSRQISTTVEFLGEKVRKIQNKDMIFSLFQTSIMGIGLEIWIDKAYKVYMIKVPMQKVTYIRKGFDVLRKPPKGSDFMSQPRFNVRKKTVLMPMRDKIKLATDLYFPKEKIKKSPVILIRTPYKKAISELDALYYAKRGYIVAVQDCRGRFDSQGVWEPFVNEAKDGYDAVEWLGKQKWSTGKVGMIGGSYVGWTQLWAAVERPPHLRTIIPNVAPPDPFYNIPYEYGVFFIFGSIWWAQILESNATQDITGQALTKINEKRYEKLLLTLPVIDLDKKLLGKKNMYWRKWIKHNVNTGYWEKSNFMHKLQKLDIPVFLQSGWFDGDGIGSKLNYMELKKSSNKYQKIILGPWGHTDQSSTRVGDHDFGKQAGIDLQTLYLRWFDYWLKGIKNGITKEPLVQIFVMFSNKWVKANTYPVPGTIFTKLYLGSKTAANTSKGDGYLDWTIHSKTEFDTYVYDPGNPTPFPEYYFKSKKEQEDEKKKTVDMAKQRKKVIAFHNQVTDKRRDILVYQTAPLKEDITIAGPVSAVIYASSSAKDTDWFVSLMDVSPDKRNFVLVKGVMRARFRNTTKKEEFLEKGKIYKYNIDMWQTGITFRKGHRIRIEISSALFPIYSRNLNTGGHNEMETKYIKATQRIYHSKKYPSHILLPVIEKLK